MCLQFNRIEVEVLSVVAAQIASVMTVSATIMFYDTTHARTHTM